MVASRSGILYSYDPVHNPMAGREEELALPPSLREAMTSFSEDEQQRIAEGYRKGMGQARRIDYIFVMSVPSHALKGCLRQELLGESTAGSTQLPASDHYGVVNTYIAHPSEC